MQCPSSLLRIVTNKTCCLLLSCVLAHPAHNHFMCVVVYISLNLTLISHAYPAGRIMSNTTLMPGALRTAHHSEGDDVFL